MNKELENLLTSLKELNENLKNAQEKIEEFNSTNTF